jgi:hypothetical protein
MKQISDPNETRDVPNVARPAKLRFLPMAILLVGSAFLSAGPIKAQMSMEAMRPILCPGISDFTQCMLAVTQYFENDWQKTPVLVQAANTECARATAMRRAGRDPDRHYAGHVNVGQAKGDPVLAGFNFAIYRIIKKNCPTAFF